MARKVTSFDDELLKLLAQKYENRRAKSIIEEGKLYNVIDDSNSSLLHIAAQLNNIEIVKYLIDSSSNLNQQNDLEQTPLIAAISRNHKDVVTTLIKAGADIELKNSHNINALQLIGGREWQSDEVLKNCLQKLQSDYSNNKEEIAARLADWLLYNVVMLKDADLTRIVLQHGHTASIETTTSSAGGTALHVAVQSFDVENVKVLVEYNANVNAMDFTNRTPLFYVYYRGDRFMRRQARNKNGDAHSNERFAILKVLLDQGALLIVSNPFEKNLEDAYDIFEFGSPEAINLLLQTKINLSLHVGPLGNTDTPIHGIARNVNASAIKELYGKSFNPNIRNSYRMTPLITAVCFAHAHAVEFLLNEGSDIDAVDDDNETAICNAFFDYKSLDRSMEQYRDCVQILLERNANVQLVICERDGLTVLNYITSCVYWQVGDLVMSYLAFKEMQGLPITQLCRDRINYRYQLRTKFESSKQCLQMNISESITLFDLLNISERKFERYVYNEELMSKIQESRDEVFQFYYFWTILKRRLSKALLVKEAVRVVCIIMGTSYEQFPDIADSIVSYLEEEDMKHLIEALQ